MEARERRILIRRQQQARQQAMQVRIERLLARREAELRALLVETIEMIDDGQFMKNARDLYADDLMDSKLASIAGYRKCRQSYLGAIDLLYLPR